jgi:RNA polymerase sigma-70 factor (ECF subfamily)
MKPKDALPCCPGEHREYLSRLAYSRCNPRDGLDLDPSDVVQEALLQAHRFRHQFRGSTTSEYRGWLRTITERLCNRVRRRKPLAFRSLDADEGLAAQVPVEFPSPHDEVAGSEGRDRMQRAVVQLPQPMREAVQLHYLEGLSVKEVAARLGRTEAGVAGLMRRGIIRLRKRLAPSE